MRYYLNEGISIFKPSNRIFEIQEEKRSISYSHRIGLRGLISYKNKLMYFNQNLHWFFVENNYILYL